MSINPDISMEQAILEAAERLFLEKGFALTSTTEIAKVVGCNQALVHYYFRTKDRLFDAIFEKKIRLFVSIFMQIDDREAPFLDKIQRKIEAHFDLVQANPGLPFLVFNELTTHPEKIDRLKTTLKEFPVSIFRNLDIQLQQEIQSGNIRPVETIDLLISIISLNIVPFLASPIIKNIGSFTDEAYQSFLLRRKNENVLMILNSLRP